MARPVRVLAASAAEEFHGNRRRAGKSPVSRAGAAGSERFQMRRWPRARRGRSGDALGASSNSWRVGAVAVVDSSVIPVPGIGSFPGPCADVPGVRRDRYTHSRGRLGDVGRLDG